MSAAAAVMGLLINSIFDLADSAGVDVEVSFHRTDRSTVIESKVFRGSVGKCLKVRYRDSMFGPAKPVIDDYLSRFRGVLYGR
jgi:hypothetical protein